MNIMSVDSAAIPDVQSGSTKTQEGVDSFFVLMAAIAAGSLIQHVNNDTTAAKGSVPELMGTGGSTPILPQLPGCIAEADPLIDGGKAKDNGLTIVSPEEKTPDLASLLNIGEVAVQVEKKGMEVPDKLDSFVFPGKSLKEMEAGKVASGELEVPEFEPVPQDIEEIASFKADSVSEGVPVFSQQLSAGTAAVEGKDLRIHSGISTDPANLIEQVSGGFKSAFKSGDGEVRLELYPESLGHLKIEIKVEGGVVRANILTENFLVKDTIDSNLLMLRKSLEDQGLRIDQLSVGVDQRQSGNAFAGREQFQMWQMFDGTGVQYRDEEQSLNGPLYHASLPLNEGVSIFV